MFEYRWRCLHLPCGLAHNNTCCPRLWPLTWLILEVIEALASLYHLGNILLHHVDDLIHLRLHPRETSGETRHESQMLTGIVCWGIITSLLSQTPDILISPFLCLTLSSWPAVKRPFYDLGVIPVPLLRTDGQSVRGHWRGNRKGWDS